MRPAVFGRLCFCLCLLHILKGAVPIYGAAISDHDGPANVDFWKGLADDPALLNVAELRNMTVNKGYVRRSSVWTDNPIPVCWEQAGHAREKRWIRTAVERSWAKHSRLRFSGWALCPPSASYKTDFPGIRVGTGDCHPHTKGLGNWLKGVEHGICMNVVFRDTFAHCGSSLDARRSCIDTIAVHEWGHAIGFAHEHNRGDRDSLCGDSAQGSDGDWKVTIYDPRSVMNYCSQIQRDSAVNPLSPLDIESVQRLYGAPKARADAVVVLAEDGRLSLIDTANKIGGDRQVDWSKVADMVRRDCGVGYFDGKIFFIGAYPPTTSVWGYSPLRSAFNTNIHLNRARQWPCNGACPSSETHLVVCGGGAAGCELLSKNTQRFEYVAPPAGTDGEFFGAHKQAVAWQHDDDEGDQGAVVLTGGLIYNDDGSFRALNQAYRLDLSTKTWSALPSLAHARWGHASAALGGNKVAVCGGRVEGSGVERQIASCELLEGGRWRPMASLRQARMNFALLALSEHYLMAVGGFANGTELDSIEVTASAGAEHWSPYPRRLNSTWGDFGAAVVDAHVVKEHPR